MAGSNKSAMLFVIAAILLVVQLVISLVGFGDGIAALASGCFVFIMIIGALFARSGGMMAVFRTVGSYDTGSGRVETREDTRQRIQATPCFGFCICIMTIVIALMFASQLSDSIGFIAVSPAMLAGILAILAGVVFVLEYRGPYSSRVF